MRASHSSLGCACTAKRELSSARSSSGGATHSSGVSGATGGGVCALDCDGEEGRGATEARGGAAQLLPAAAAVEVVPEGDVLQRERRPLIAAAAAAAAAAMVAPVTAAAGAVGETGRAEEALGTTAAESAAGAAAALTAGGCSAACECGAEAADDGDDGAPACGGVRPRATAMGEAAAASGWSAKKRATAGSDSREGEMYRIGDELPRHQCLPYAAKHSASYRSSCPRGCAPGVPTQWHSSVASAKSRQTPAHGPPCTAMYACAAFLRLLPASDGSASSSTSNTRSGERTRTRVRAVERSACIAAHRTTATMHVVAAPQMDEAAFAAARIHCRAGRAVKCSTSATRSLPGRGAEGAAVKSGGDGKCHQTAWTVDECCTNHAAVPFVGRAARENAAAALGCDGAPLTRWRCAESGEAVVPFWKMASRESEHVGVASKSATADCVVSTRAASGVPGIDRKSGARATTMVAAMVFHRKFFTQSLPTVAWASAPPSWTLAKSR
jgi:hypothetical protein